MSKQLTDAWKEVLGKKADRAIIRYAITGDGSSAANANVTGRTGMAWVRYDEKDDRASQVMNYRFPGIAQGVPVVVGKQYPTDRFFQILGLNVELYYQSMPAGTFPAYLIPPHGSTHTGTSGSDPAPIVINNIVHGRMRPTSPVSMNVFVETLYYEYNGTITYWYGGTVSLAAHSPPDTGTHRYVLISINATTNALATTAGVIVPSPVSPTLPDVPMGHIPIGAVMLQDSTTAITYSILYDYRILFAVAGSVAQQINQLLAIVADDWDFEFSKHVVEGE